MAFNIGAIVSVGGEREYNQAMANIRQNLKYVTAEMKNVTSEYNTNEKSVESLTRQNEVLEKVLAEQNSAVRETQAALSRLADAGVEPTTKAYKDLEANLNYAKAAVNDTTREIRINADAIADASKSTQDFSEGQDDGAKKTGDYKNALSNLSEIFGIKIPDGILESVDKLGIFDGASNNTKEKTVGGFGDIIGAIGGIGPAALGAVGAIAGIGIAAAKMVADTILEIDRLSARLQVALGLTDEEAKAAASTIEAVYAGSLVETRAEAEQAVTAVMRLMDASGKDAVDYATQVATINEVWGADFSETARTAATLMKTFGISGQEALDLIATGLQTSANKNGDLLDVLNEYSPAFARLGDDAETFLSKLVAGTDAGAFSADKAADVYKELFNKAADGNKDFQDAIDALGLSSATIMRMLLSGGKDAQTAIEMLMERLDGVTNKAKQNQIASKLIGTQWEDVGTKAVTAMGNVKDAVVDTTDASTKATGDMVDTLSGKWDRFWKLFKENPVGKGTILQGIDAFNAIFPAYASGTPYHPGGLALVGDNGPELIDLRRGARVYNNADTTRILNSGGGIQVGALNVYPNERQWAQLMSLVSQAQNARQGSRAAKGR